MENLENTSVNEVVETEETTTEENVKTYTQEEVLALLQSETDKRVKQPDGTIKCLTPRQAGDLLGHSTSQITEMYYVKRDNSRLVGITDSFEI